MGIVLTNSLVFPVLLFGDCKGVILICVFGIDLRKVAVAMIVLSLNLTGREIAPYTQ